MAWERTFRASPVYSTGANSSKIWKFAKNVRKFPKKSENVRTLPNASGCIPAHPNRSGWVRMDPNAFRNLEKLQKAGKNLQKIAKNRENFAKHREHFRVWAVVDFCERIAWLLCHPRAYRLSSRAPDVRMSHYLQHLDKKGGSVQRFALRETIDLELFCRYAGSGVTVRRTEPGNGAHAFRMTLVAQGKLLQNITYHTVT